MALVLDDEEKNTGFKYRHKKIANDLSPQDTYYAQIVYDNFGACEELYKNEEVPYLLKSYNEYDVTRKINKDKYNGPFDWIRVVVSDDYTSNSIEGCLQTNIDFYVLGKNVKLGHNDFWLWIEDDEQSTDMRKFVQTIKKYNEKELIIIEKHTFLNSSKGYKFAGYGRFDKKQSICQKRFVFKRVTE